MKHVIKGFITYRATPYSSKPHVTFVTYDPRQFETDNEHPAIVVREHSFEIEIADDYDPRADMIAALEMQKQKVRAEFSKRITDIETQISKLQALTFEAA